MTGHSHDPMLRGNPEIPAQGLPMRRLALPLLLASTLLAACGGGGGGGSGNSNTDSGNPGDITPPPAVTGHFFSYVSDGSHIHAVDMSSGEVTEVATLAVPTEELNYTHLQFRRGLLGERTIEWRDLLFVDDGKLYLLPAHSETTSPPVPRQLSSMSTIDTTCGKHASVSADGKHEGLLFFRPDVGEDCYGGAGTSYLITTDMGPEDAPVTGPASWSEDMAVSQFQKGIRRITGFVGIRDNKLVLMNTAHQATTVLTSGVADISYMVTLNRSSSDKIFVSTTTTGGQSRQYFIDVNNKTVVSTLGEEFRLSTFSGQIYSLYTPFMSSNSKAYVAGMDGSPAKEIACTYSSASPIAVIGDLMLVNTSSSVKTLNLKTCEEKLLIDNSPGNMYRFYIENNVAYFNDPDQPLIHRLNIVSLDDATMAQAKISGSTFTLQGSAASTRNSFILLSNLDKSDGESLRLESYDLQGERLVLGELDRAIDTADASFWNNSGHELIIGTISFSDADEQQHSQLYSLKASAAGNLTLLLEKEFLQAL